MSRPDPRPLPRATWRELAARTRRALRREPEEASDRSFARSLLTAAEFALWIRQSPYDRRHAVRVARRVEARLAGTAHANDPTWVAAALMHDVGKLDAGLSLIARAMAALANRLVGLGTARRWARSRRAWVARLGRYLTHGEVGARMIRDAGGREEIAAWTEVHQGCGDTTASGVPPDVVAALIGSDVA